MKHFILFFFATTLFCQGQIIDFPDPNFKNALIEDHWIDRDGDGEITVTEAQNHNGWISVNEKNISDLTGIEYFTNITTLSCGGNNLTQLDLSSNFSRMDFLDVSNNQLSDLDLSNISNSMYGLWVSFNNLTELDLSNKYMLNQVKASNNQLINIILPDDGNLLTLELDNNQLTNIDLSNSTRLRSLLISNNDLNNLDLTANPDLRTVFCSYNQLTNLDLNSNPELVYLRCENNQLTELDLTIQGLWREILCSNNQLTQLHIESDSYLVLDCSDNQLTDLTITSNDDYYVQRVKCSGNSLSELDLSDSRVTVLDCSDNPLLQSINWQNGLNYKFNPNNTYNGFENLPNLSTVCYGPGYYQELQDFILADVGRSVDFYNNETCDALSVNENNLQELSITPNPAENSIKIEADTPISEIVVYNELGQLVLSRKLNIAMDKTLLDISILAQGLYFVKVCDIIGKTTVKNVIKK